MTMSYLAIHGSQQDDLKVVAFLYPRLSEALAEVQSVRPWHAYVEGVCHVVR